MTAEKREQFQALLDDVEQGRNAYNIVLYLEESRWGRFVNSREADYHRMRLERQNVVCQSCDQPLTLASNIAYRIITLLRDESASDYCRQLSQKVFLGQCNLIMKGGRISSLFFPAPTEGRGPKLRAQSVGFSADR